MQVIVSAMHRSGTSVLARLINLMGAYFGPEGIGIAPSEANAKGFWERRDILALHTRILRSQGADWDKPHLFDLEAMEVELRRECEQTAKKIIYDMDAHRPWVAKDPRFALTLPFWLPLLEAPVVVNVYRNPCEVAASLETRDGLPFPVGVALWEFYVLAEARNSLGQKRVGISHARLSQDPWHTASELFERLGSLGVKGLSLPDKESVLAYFDAGLHRQRVSDSAMAKQLVPAQLEVWNALSRDDLAALAAMQPSAATLAALRGHQLMSAKIDSSRKLPLAGSTGAATPAGSESKGLKSAAGTGSLLAEKRSEAALSVLELTVESLVKKLARAEHKLHLKTIALERNKTLLEEKQREAKIPAERLQQHEVLKQQCQKLQERLDDQDHKHELECAMLRASVDGLAATLSKKELAVHQLTARKSAVDAEVSSLRSEVKKEKGRLQEREKDFEVLQRRHEEELQESLSAKIELSKKVTSLEKLLKEQKERNKEQTLELVKISRDLLKERDKNKEALVSCKQQIDSIGEVYKQKTKARDTERLKFVEKLDSMKKLLHEQRERSKEQARELVQLSRALLKERTLQSAGSTGVTRTQLSSGFNPASQYLSEVAIPSLESIHQAAQAFSKTPGYRLITFMTAPIRYFQGVEADAFGYILSKSEKSVGQLRQVGKKNKD